ALHRQKARQAARSACRGATLCSSFRTAHSAGGIPPEFRPPQHPVSPPSLVASNLPRLHRIGVKSHNRQPRRSRSAAAPTNRSRRSANRGGKSHGPALLFDLDGTLVDSVYEHTLCWHEALQRQRIPVQVWKIHRRIGMTGRLLLHALFRDLGREADPAQIEMLEKLHKENYAARLPNIRVLPGSRELLHRLSDSGIAWAIGS